ncbi:MAG: molybdopterin-dependent oxidoreductase [Ardenticatenaceae bacterium]|nr:molybdopterin-dependent oxidoreductase [Ardenticatenaceae bacterium]
MSDFAHIGRRTPKPDAVDKVSGRAVYGHDLRPPRMLYGKILRSPHAHARILNIDASRAARLPGVKAIITGAGIPDRKFGYGRDILPLKRDKVRRVGDEVAAVAAVDEDTALEALALIRVDYEPLAGVFDPHEAIREGAPLIHEELGTNLFRHQDYVHGDPERALDAADVVVEDEFKLGYVTAAALETSFCLASFETSGHLTVYSTTQVPYLLQRDLSDALGISGGNIRVIQTAIGGAFGRGLDMYSFEPICVYLAKAAGRPVRLVYTREEEFMVSPMRQPIEVLSRAGATNEGDLLVRWVDATLDNGAYVSWGTVTTLVMMETVGSLYRVPHCRFKNDIVYTNNPITGAVRGFGNPQSTFWVEVQMDRLAEKLGMDPLEFRIRNANQPFSETPQGLKITSCGLTECLEEAGRRIGWGRERPPAASGAKRRGIGFATTMNVGGGARIYRSDGCGSIVRVDDFGRVTLISGATEIGQGSDAVLSQIVAEELGVRPEAVTISNNDTIVAPWDVGVHASRTTFIAGKAAQLAAQEARLQILETAEEMLEVPRTQLELRDGLVRAAGDPERALPLSKVVRARHFRDQGSMIIGEAFYDPPNEMLHRDLKGNISAAYSFGAHAAEVEVDLETGEVRVVRIVAAHDVGRALNPMYVEGQIEGGIHMGLGYALLEELQLREGKVLNPQFLDYRLATALDMPQIEPVIVETIDPEGPFGAKGVGEMGITPVAPAIANAIHDAVRVRLRQLPMTPERVLEALRAAEVSERLKRRD